MPGQLIDIRLDDHGALSRLEGYPELQKQAVDRTLNRVIEWCKTQTSGFIRRKLNVTKRNVDEHLIIRRATWTNKVAHMTVSGSRMPLSMFKSGRMVPPFGKRQTGIKYQINKDGGVRTLTGNAFYVPIGSGRFMRRTDDTHEKVIAKSGKRAGKYIWSATHIAMLRGPSIPQVTQELPEFQKLLQVDAGKRLEKQMEREVNFILMGRSNDG